MKLTSLLSIEAIPTKLGRLTTRDSHLTKFQRSRTFKVMAKSAEKAVQRYLFETVTWHNPDGSCTKRDEKMQTPSIGKKVDSFEVDQHEPDGSVRFQIFSCAEKWPEKAGLYLTQWVRDQERDLPRDPERDLAHVRYIDPKHGASFPIYQSGLDLRSVIDQVKKGRVFSVEECSVRVMDNSSLYWTDAPLPDWVIVMLNYQKISL